MCIQEKERENIIIIIIIIIIVTVLLYRWDKMRGQFSTETLIKL